MFPALEAKALKGLPSEVNDGYSFSFEAARAIRVRSRDLIKISLGIGRINLDSKSLLITPSLLGSPQPWPPARINCKLGLLELSLISSPALGILMTSLISRLEET